MAEESYGVPGELQPATAGGCAAPAGEGGGAELISNSLLAKERTGTGDPAEAGGGTPGEDTATGVER